MYLSPSQRCAGYRLLRPAFKGGFIGFHFRRSLHPTLHNLHPSSSGGQGYFGDGFAHGGTFISLAGSVAFIGVAVLALAGGVDDLAGASAASISQPASILRVDPVA